MCSGKTSIRLIIIFSLTFIFCFFLHERIIIKPTINVTSKITAIGTDTPIPSKRCVASSKRFDRVNANVNVFASVNASFGGLHLSIIAWKRSKLQNFYFAGTC